MMPVLSRFRSFATILALIASSSASAVPATDSSKAASSASNSISESRCILTIDTLHVSNGELFDTLDVTVETFDVDLAGFGLKLGTNSVYLDIVEILPGEIIDSCGWYMFRASEIGVRSEPGGPAELWQLTGMAQSFSDADTLLCYQFNRPASIARIVVSSAHVPIVPDTSVALFFYWEACRDNVISDAEGAAILISDTVFDAFPVGLETESDQFPTSHGTPSECVSARARSTPRRLVEFRNGGVEFRLDVEFGE